MKILNAITEQTILTELSYLNGDVSVGASSIIVDNADGFATDDYIVFERKGTETAEIIKIATVSGQTITLSNVTLFAHKSGIRVQKILYNQRKFYSCATQTGTYSYISGSAKNIEVDRPDGTFYEHSAGTSATWYKATYYNSTSVVETELSDCIASKGSDSNHYTAIYDIRKQAGFEDAFGISDELIADYREEAENEFESRIATIYSTPLSSKPKVGRQIVNLLAAGNLLIKEYGMEADIEISKSGERMLVRANDLIGKIVEGTLKLIDDSGNLIGQQATTGITGSNTFTSQSSDKGQFFNLGDEPLISPKNPKQPRS